MRRRRSAGWKSILDEDFCAGCGSCSTVCPSGAMEQLGYNEEQTLDMVDFSLVNL
ncbi:MAG: 4Fe-4S binding protein [Candidatus Aegiribacteria sp.]|nr:4Fe-4S binding protein [Candidatus Aegiribacteria sp.]